MTTQDENITNKTFFMKKQLLNMNNIRNCFNKKEIYLTNFLDTNIFDNDEIMVNKLYNNINNPYQKKINLINLILNSNINLQLNNSDKVLKFFAWLLPLTIEFNMGFNMWNIKTVKYGNIDKIFIQNSISKKDMHTYFYKNYINLIKQSLTNSNVNYHYFEFKSKRFNKIKDIIFVIDK